MTRGCIREYTEAVRGRYFLASKSEKGKILDEFTEVTDCHRKTAIRLFPRQNQPRANKKRGHPCQYGTAKHSAIKFNRVAGLIGLVRLFTGDINH